MHIIFSNAGQSSMDYVTRTDSTIVESLKSEISIDSQIQDESKYFIKPKFN